jgi:YD repeat-containing protein
MVAIITGKGTGLERSSAWVLGSRGQLGAAATGRDGEGVYVNAASGNLVITRRDEFLIGRGPDIAIDRTYNSQGDLSDDNGDNWRMGVYRKVTGLSGSYGAAGSTVKRIDWDGSDTLFTWNATYIDATHGAYVATDGRGAYDTLIRASGVWTWTDGDTQGTESYDDNNGGRITATSDTDGNGLTYTYTSGLITRVTNSNGAYADEYTDLVYSGTLLQKLETHAGGTLTRVFYTYDTYNRLSQVKTNLNPSDNSDTTGSNYVTTYTYDGTSKRVASITQTDGSVLQIGYTLVGSIYKVSTLTQTVASGVTRVSTIQYFAVTATRITDPAGQQTTLQFDSTTTNNLNYITHLADAYSPMKQVSFQYNSNGDVTSAGMGPANTIAYEYDSHGNRITECDSVGNTVKRTYGVKNELLTETRYAVADADGLGAGYQAADPMTTRYAYDAQGHLRFVVSATGFVTQYQYETNAANLGYGQQIAAIDYAANAYDVSGLAANVSIAEGTLTTWVNGIGDKSTTLRSQTEYDFRGNVTTVKSYSKLLSSGQFDTSSELSQTLYVYDPAGNLLTRQINGSSATETFVYDGLNRISSSTDFNNVATSIAFNDASQTTVVTLANGLVTTSLYNLAGELITYTEAGSGVTTAATNYRYDNLGRLRVTTDAIGQRDFFFYDSTGQKIGEVDSDGSVTEYRYNGSGSVTSSTRYATKLPGFQLASLADANGNPTSVYFWQIRPVQQANDRWTWQMYDDAQRLVRAIDGTGATTAYTYDGASRLTATKRYSSRISAAALALLRTYPTSIHNGGGAVYNMAWTGGEYDYSNATQVAAGTINGLEAYKFTATAEYYPAYMTWTDEAWSANPIVVTSAITIKAVGSATSHEFGLYDDLAEEPQWAFSASGDAVILSGPGTLTLLSNGLWRISGLSTTQATRVQISRIAGPYQYSQPRFFITTQDPMHNGEIQGDAVILSNPYWSYTAYFPPALPYENPWGDRLSRNFYDGDGRLTGTLDAEGFLTKILYDKAGRKTQTIAYSQRTSTSLQAAGTFAQVLASIPPDNANDVRNYFVYDARGLLRATVDGEGDLTRYRYHPLGHVDQVVSGQKLDPAALMTTPPTLANLPAAPSGAILQTITYTVNHYGQVLTEQKSLTGSTTTTTAFTYDNMRRLVATTTQSGGADPRAQTERYDLRGRLTGELGGIGSAALATLLGTSPTQTQIDALWADYGTGFVYDAADRMISSTDPNGARTLYYYDADDRLAFQVNALGETVEHRYNALGDRSDVVFYAARVASGTLAGMSGGAVTSVASTMAALANSALDEVSHVDFDVDGTVRQSIDELGNVTLYYYDAFGAVVDTIEPLDAGETDTVRSYDRRGLLMMERREGGGIEIQMEYGHNAFGRVTDVIKGYSATDYFYYDRAGRLISRTDAWENPTNFTYDARGNRVASTDVFGSVTRYVFDKANRQIATIDALGGVITTSYDADGRVVATRAYLNRVTPGSLPLEVTESALSLPGTNAADQVTRYAYDKDGRLRFTIDALMHVVEYAYDDAGNVMRTVGYDGTIGTDGTGAYSVSWIATQVAALAGAAGTRITRSVYDAAGRLNYSVDATGQATWFVYDAKGRVVRQVEYAALYTATGDPSVGTMDTWRGANANATNDRTTRAYYDRKGQLNFSIDALGFVTRFEYDKRRHVKKQTSYADAYSATDATTLANLAAAFASPPSTARLTQFSHDGAGNCYETIDPEGYSTVQWYDEKNRVVGSVVAYGTAAARTTTYLYDDLDRVVVETRGYGSAEATMTLFEYDALGQVENRIDAYNTADEATTHFEYDLLGQVTRMVRGYNETEAAETLTAYDAFGRVTSTTDARGSVITRSYDVLDELLAETQELEAGTTDDRTTTFTYDSFGDSVKVHDARGNDSFAYYDKLGRVFRQVDGEKYVTDMTYTRGGQVWTTKRWANPATGTIVETSVPANPTADAVRDATTTFTYNKRDELTAVQDAVGYTEGYTLNAFGERIQVRNKLHGSVVAGVTLDTNVYYTFDKRGLMKSETLPVTTKTSAGATISVINSYEYDARGNRSKMIEAEGAAEVRTTNYFYDKLDRLITTTHDAVTVVNTDLTGTSGIVPQESIKYDRRGNVIETVDAGGARTLFWYDDLDRAIAQVIQTAKISGVEKGTLIRTTYDGNGNVTSVKVYGDPPITLPADATGAIPSPSDANNYRLTSYTYYRDNRVKEAIVAAVTSGEWNGSSYVLTPGLISGAPNPAAEIRTLVEYDKAGNVTHEEDGRGNDLWRWYDKLGRKSAEVDAENYLTVWTRDAEGNVSSETRYATQLSGFAPGPTPPTVGASAADRTTSFLYDRNGRRTQEQRLAVAYTSIDTGTGAATDVAATDVSAKSTVTYSYNGLGEVLTRTEAAGATAYTYDTIGRMTFEVGQSFTDYQGAGVTPRTAYGYDGLNNIKSTRVQMGAAANDTNDRITTSTYGAGGRLATMTNAANFTHTYGYDAAGRMVRDSYTRVKSNGSSITEAQVTRYDIAGRAITQTSARLSGSTWLFTDEAGAAYDAVRMRYNAFGEISGRGLTAGPNAAEAYQESFEYDGGGRLWKSTQSDGVLRFHVYDKASNLTLTLASTGADLSGLTLANYTGSITGSGDTNTPGAVSTIAVFDKRGQQVRTREPDRQLSASATQLIVHGRTYNAFGEVASETDARGFDASGNAITFTGGAGYTTTFGYNAMGRLVSKVSPQVSVTDEYGGVSNVNPAELYGYDLSGRLVSVIDANNNRTTRLLLAGTGLGDSQASTLKEFTPHPSVFERKYDVFGAQRVTVDGLGKTETFLYDKMNRLVRQDHPVRPAGSLGNTTGADIQLIDEYGYDGLGRRTQHWNSQLTAAVKETTDYDAQGRVEKTVDFGGDSTITTYAWSPTIAANGLDAVGGGWAKTTYNPDGTSQREDLDYFGRAVDRVDAGLHDYDLTFDHGGRLTEQSIVGVATTSMSWFNTGLIATQSANGLTAAYGYDGDGRRTLESYGAYQNATVTWDALGRMKTYADTGAVGGTAPADIAYEYDAVGNVRRMAAHYSNMDSQGVIFGSGYDQEYWYKYDSLNRFTTTKGVFTGTPGSGAIVGGTQISYDAAGNRATATMTVLRTKPLQKYVPRLGPPTPRYFDDDAEPVTFDDGEGTWSDVDFPFYSGQVETYSYTADGYLAGVSVATQELLPTGNFGTANPQVGTLGASVARGGYEVDAMGRVTVHREYNPAGTEVYSRAATYNPKSQLTGDIVTSLVANATTGGTDSIETTTDYYYTTLGGAYLGGVIDRQVTTNKKGGTLEATVTITNSYDLWEGRRKASSTEATDYVTATDTNYGSYYYYDGLGHLSSVSIGGGRARTATFVTDIDGRVLQRDEEDGLGTGDPRDLHYYFNGVQLGGVSNNGTTDVDYVTGIAQHTAAPGTGPFQGGSANASNYVDFDQSYDPINGLNSSSSAARYTTSQGDTLQAIALAVWGDASLWYLIANANGFMGGETLAAGITLSIPNKVTNFRNSSDTFKVYDPNEALGDLSPTAPKPPKAAKKGCGVIGMILLVAIAVAVTIVTSGAALAALSPAVGSIGMGISVVMGTASAAISGAVGLGSMIAAGAIGGAVGSIVSQGVGVATGLQDKFSWKGVAMGAISGAIGAGLGKFSALSNLGPAGQAAKIGGTLGKIGQFLGKGNFIAGAARGVITSAASQGIGVATGLQDKFSWAGVAAAGIGGGVSSAIGARLEGWNRYGAQLVSGAAGAIANAATRTVIEGSDFGDNILAALPDVIGSTLGNLIAGGLAARGAPAAPQSPAAEPPPERSILVDGDPALGIPPLRDYLRPISPFEPGALFSQPRVSVIAEDMRQTVTRLAAERDAGQPGSTPYFDDAGRLRFQTGGSLPLWRWAQYEAGLGWAQAREDYIRDAGGALRFASRLAEGAEADGRNWQYVNRGDYYLVAADNLDAIRRGFVEYGPQGLPLHAEVAEALEWEVRYLRRTGYDMNYNDGVDPDPGVEPFRPPETAFESISRNIRETGTDLGIIFDLSGSSSFSDRLNALGRTTGRVVRVVAEPVIRATTGVAQIIDGDTRAGLTNIAIGGIEWFGPRVVRIAGRTNPVSPLRLGTARTPVVIDMGLNSRRLAIGAPRIAGTPNLGGRVVANAGPVIVRLPKAGATAAEVAQLRAYTQLSNDALFQNRLSPTGRVSTQGVLRTDASYSARLERAQAQAAGIPYQGHAGHTPDTTWAGEPDPFAWLDLSPRVNMSLGSQAARYPIGYRPTRFIFELDR